MISLLPATWHQLARVLLICLALFLFIMTPDGVLAHQSITHPVPMTKDGACRITKRRRCPGPCPTDMKRYDRTPDNPSIVTSRGKFLKVHTMRNNHDGGFSRWAIVNVADKMSKAAHTRNAFHFNCADVGRRKCNAAYKNRDCYFDRDNLHYTHLFRIPTCIPDGIYVLGWTWYGGGLTFGHFGDYWDCMFIEIKGGEFTRTYRPRFVPGKSITSKDGKCTATVNRIGICPSEPCPGGGRRTTYQIPWEFDNGRKPAPLRASEFRPYKRKPKRKNSPRVHSLTIRSADKPHIIHHQFFPWRKVAHIRITRSMRVTITCEVTGRAKSATFYTNGNKGHTDPGRPFSAGGDWYSHREGRRKYAHWKFDMYNKASSISCRAVGYDGTEDWLSVTLTTAF